MRKVVITMALKKILANKWLKFGLSFIPIVYFIYALWFSVNSFLYKVEIHSEILFGLLFFSTSVLFLAIMIFTRNELITKILSLLMPFATFLIFIMNLNNLLVAIPFLLVSFGIFIICKTQETIKTILGAGYILLYVLGTIIFFVIKILFGSSVDSTILSLDVKNNNEIMQFYSDEAINRANYKNVSPNGKNKYYIVDVLDKNVGRIDVFIAPNDKDKDYRTFSFVEAGTKRRISYMRERGDMSVPIVKWINDDEISVHYQNFEPEITKLENVEVNEILINSMTKDYFYFFYE